MRFSSLYTILIVKGESDCLSVLSGVTLREDLSDIRHEFFGAGQRRAVMGQPHPGGRRLFRDRGSLHKGHVLVLACLGGLVGLAVHALTDQKVRARRVFHDTVAGAGVRRINQLQTLSGRTQNHIGCVDAIFGLYGLPFLQPAPEPDGNVLLPGARGVKSACPVQGKCVAVAGDVVIHTEGVDMKVLVPGQSDLLLALGQFQKLYFKRESPERSHAGCSRLATALWARSSAGLGALGISHREQHPRKS